MATYIIVENYSEPIATELCEMKRWPASDPDVRHPTYWNRVKLGGLLLLGVITLPLFILGVLVKVYRRIHDSFQNL